MNFAEEKFDVKFYNILKNGSRHFSVGEKSSTEVEATRGVFGQAQDLPLQTGCRFV